MNPHTSYQRMRREKRQQYRQFLSWCARAGRVGVTSTAPPPGGTRLIHGY